MNEKTPVLPQPAAKTKAFPLAVIIGAVVLLLGSVVVAFLLMAGGIEQVGERSFATMLLLTTFVLMLLLLTKVKHLAWWVQPLHLLFSIYGFLVSMLHTWVYGHYSYAPESGGIVLYLLLPLTVLSLGQLCAVLVMTLTEIRIRKAEPGPANTVTVVSAVISSLLAFLCSALLVLPPIFETLDRPVSGIFWRITVVVLIFASTFIAITVLLVFTMRVRAPQQAANGVHQVAQSVQ